MSNPLLFLYDACCGEMEGAWLVQSVAVGCVESQWQLWIPCIAWDHSLHYAVVTIFLQFSCAGGFISMSKMKLIRLFGILNHMHILSRLNRKNTWTVSQLSAQFWLIAVVLNQGLELGANVQRGPRWLKIIKNKT